MSMHLARGLTTTSTRKRKTKITKAQQEEFERGWRDRNKRLKEMHLPKETFEQYMEWIHGRGKKEKIQTAHRPAGSSTITEPCNPAQQKNGVDVAAALQENPNTNIPNDVRARWTTGACATKQTPTYTGTKMIGIAVLHKSCLQPVFSQEEATDIARMRR